MKWKVYSDLADMCLSIGLLKEALIYAQTSRKNKPELYAYDYILPGRILKEKDITMCVDYYSKLLHLESLQKYHTQIEKEYLSAIKLKQQGYKHKYKPFNRPARIEHDENLLHCTTMTILKETINHSI